MTKYLLPIITLFGSAIFLPFVCNADSSDEIISKRIRGMQNADLIMSQIKRSVVQKDFKQLNQKTVILKKLAKKMVTFFPIGTEASTNNFSAASIEIWEQPVKFNHLIKTLQSNVRDMLSASKNNDLNRYNKTFLSTKQLCNSCHERFRN